MPQPGIQRLCALLPNVGARVGDWKQREFNALRDLVVAHTVHQVCEEHGTRNAGNPGDSSPCSRPSIFHSQRLAVAERISG